jgi:O-acetyl-ADP-ribose deacetylase (regulator of RNase III)
MAFDQALGLGQVDDPEARGRCGTRNEDASDADEQRETGARPHAMEPTEGRAAVLAALARGREDPASMGRILLAEGDITALAVDAIVNAANTELQLGSGVAGAIRERGGPAIQAECDAHGPIPLGAAALTGAGKLAAKHVIHAAAMEPGARASEASIRAATRASLELARARRLRSIAFPALGAGVGAFPVQRCAEVMLEEVRAHLAGETTLDEVHFVLFGEPTYRVFEMVNDAERVRSTLARLAR